MTKSWERLVSILRTFQVEGLEARNVRVNVEGNRDGDEEDDWIPTVSPVSTRFIRISCEFCPSEDVSIRISWGVLDYLLQARLASATIGSAER